MRPKLAVAPGGPPADFHIERMPVAAPGGRARAAGWINLYGIESPGITSSFAIAAHVARMLEEDRSLA